MRTLLLLFLAWASAAVGAPPQSTLPPLRSTPNVLTFREFTDGLIAQAMTNGRDASGTFIYQGRDYDITGHPDHSFTWTNGPQRAAVPASPPVTQQVAYQPAPLVQQPRPVVAARPFRGGAECEYDPDHVCNRCGATQLVIARHNRDGTHTHVCSRCGHSWRHRN